VRSVYQEYDDSREDWFHSLLNRALYFLVFVAAVILAICWFLPLVRDQQRQQVALQNLREQVNQERSLLDKQTQKLSLLQNDPGYLELFARDKLDLMRPGETIFRMDPAPETNR
jgi:cell division protein FtsB